MHFPTLGASAGRSPAILAGATPARAPLVVFSPWRWDGDVARPQQLLTRLARHYQVFYVEEPVTTHEDAYLACANPVPGVEVLVPHTRVDAPGFHDDQIPVLQALLSEFLAGRGVSEPLVWLYTPMALPLVADLAPRCVLVDCAEDLASLPDAPRQLRQRESALMKMADVVVAAGPSLYQARRGLNANVHCIPNAVDAEHFTPARLAAARIEAVSARALHASIPNPRLGWFGPIDERIDLDLVAHLADQRPDWHIVMAGPVVRIDPATLPRRPNIHWVGPQTYAILPHLLAHWDVCLLPLKFDASTRQAAPQVTLEYLAGQKPVVGTPVHDVVALYGHIVRLAPTPNLFVEACRAALTERGPLRRQRRIDALISVHSCTWDRAAERMHRLLVESAQESGASTAPALPAALLTSASVTGAPRPEWARYATR